MALPITAFFAGVLALWILFLLFKVVAFRRANQVAMGAGGDKLGECLIRGHGNATENIPIFLIMLGLAEGIGTASWFLYALAIVFCIGRFLHGVHFMKVREGITLRFYGMLMTLLANGVLAVRLVLSVVL